jgi:hypothetical protein
MVVAILLIAAIMFGSAQAEGQKKKPAPPKVVKLTGCVERDQTAPDQYTVTDTNEGVKYRVTGKDFREYLGRSVQVDGGVVVKGIVIKGGLQPTANIAAQAGALDPSRAVVEAQTTGTATGSTNNLQEFRVKTIRTTGGSCK